MNWDWKSEVHDARGRSCTRCQRLEFVEKEGLREKLDKGALFRIAGESWFRWKIEVLINVSGCGSVKSIAQRMDDCAGLVTIRDLGVMCQLGEVMLGG